jgi:hypothetical protein
MHGDSHERRAGAASSDGLTITGYRLAVWLLAALAVVMILWNAHRQFFIYDDWTYWTTRQDFLAGGGIKGVLKVLFVPHNGQLPTLTFLVWLPLDWLFGMHTYLPYVIPVILIHLATGLLLFELLVTRLRPGVALGAAALYLFMGNAAGSASTASHLGWTIAIPAVLFGLLAIGWYDGVSDRRLVLSTLGAALVGGTAMGFVVLFVLGVALAVRKRYSIAFVVAAGFGLFFVGWRVLGSSFAVSGTGRGGVSLAFGVGRVADYISYIWSGLMTTTADLLATGFLPLALVLLVAIAVAAFWTVLDGREYLYVATAGGALFFYSLVAMRGVELNLPAYIPEAPRYMLVAGTLMLPSLAWLADRLISARRWVAVPLALMLGWAVIGNVSRHLEAAEGRVALGTENRATIETAVSMLDRLEPLSEGILFAGHSARISLAQLERLDSLGKLPCLADYERALDFAMEQGLPVPAPSEVTCD